MAMFDLADESVPLPTQLVLDTSLLPACRDGDDNPCSETAQKFIRRLGQQVSQYQMVAWLLIPVLQECYHIILSQSLRRSWGAMPRDRRPPTGSPLISISWICSQKGFPI